jgi:hypothetical protein
MGTTGEAHLYKNLFLNLIKSNPIKEMAFTFKTTKSTGRFRSFNPDLHEIKLNKKVVGSISDSEPYKISLMVKKVVSEGTVDNNVNCGWTMIRFKHESATLKEAQAWLNEKFDLIIKQNDIYTGE